MLRRRRQSPPDPPQAQQLPVKAERALRGIMRRGRVVHRTADRARGSFFQLFGQRCCQPQPFRSLLFRLQSIYLFTVNVIIAGKFRKLRPRMFRSLRMAVQKVIELLPLRDLFVELFFQVELRL